MQLVSPLSYPEWRLNAELLACIVWRLFPDVELLGGGLNSLGFYYEFLFRQPLSAETIELIEIELHRFNKEGYPLRYFSMMRENAQAFLEHHHHPTLGHLAGNTECNIVELIQVGDFYGLCPELAISSTAEVGQIKILEWKEIIHSDGVKSIRLIATSRPQAKELRTFLKTYDQFLKKKDHRILGPKLNLFSFSDSLGSLGVIWHPKGIQLLRIIEDLANDRLRDSFSISTPIAVPEGAALSFRESLEPFEFDGVEYHLRSSFLLQHLQSLKNLFLASHSLPWEIREIGSIFFDHPESQRWGLFLACNARSDHTTICCKREQVVQELISSLQLIEQIITIFGFKARWILVVGPSKSQNSRQGQEARGWLEQAYSESGCRLPLSNELPEEGNESLRMELRISDALGREWAASALSIVSSVPKDMREWLQPSLVVLTRQIWISLERFVGLLLEHFEGELPFWLTPEQVRVVAIGETNTDYAKEIVHRLAQHGLRVKLDSRLSPLSGRIHEAEKESVPYILLVGEQERLKQKLCVRGAGKPHHDRMVDLEMFLSEISKLDIA